MSRIANRAGWLLTALLVGSACNDKGTYVKLEFTGSVQPTSITCALMLGGKSASATFGEKSGAAIQLPLTGSLQIESGEGTLTAACDALRDGSTLAHGTATVTVTRDKTTSATIAFGATPPDLGVDAGTDMAGDAATPTDLSMAPPHLALTPAMHDFGTTTTATSSLPFTFTATYTGSAPSGVITVAIEGTGPFTVASSSDCSGKTLSSGETCTVSVVYSPTTSGASSGTLRVSYPGLATADQGTAPLAGTGVAPGSLMFSPTSWPFGNVSEGLSAAKTFTLTNTGGVAVPSVAVMLDASSAPDYAITSNSCPATLMPSATCSVAVTFAPMHSGGLTANLDATGTGGGTAIAMISGTGQAPPMLGISGAGTMASPASFGTVDVGTTSSPHTVTLNNSGDIATGNLSFTLVGLGTSLASEIATSTAGLMSPCVAGMPLAAHTSCAISVVLTPTTFGPRSFRVDFSASPGNTVSTYVNGTGQDHVTLEVDVAGDGTVTSTDGFLDCSMGMTPCTHTYARTATIAISLTPTANTGSSFGAWMTTTGAPPCTLTGNVCGLTLDSTVAANTTTTPYGYTATFTMP